MSLGRIYRFASVDSEQRPANHAATGALVAARLKTDATRGLEAQDAADRLRADGPNELDRRQDVSRAGILRAQLRSPMTWLLLAAAAFSAALGDVTESVVILGVVVLNVSISFRQEFRAATSMASLQAMTAPTVTVTRNGAQQQVAARELVTGDLVHLDAGSRVPADGRLVQAHALRVDESALTGESVLAEKASAAVAPGTPLGERTSMVHAGSSVAAGRGSMLVTAVGMRSELGRVAGLLTGADPAKTPLQRRLDVLVRRLAVAAGAVVVVVFAVGLAQGEPLDTLLLTAISLAVAAIPESLPAVVTITLALGAQRMLRRQALIRRLYAVETLGSVTTICSDKTGTLTQNRMTVVLLETAAARCELTEPPPADQSGAPRPLAQPTPALLLIGCALSNDATRDQDGSLLGDPTETALVSVADSHGFAQQRLQCVLPRVDELPFDSERKRMTTVHTLPAHLDALPAPLFTLVQQTPLSTPAARVAFTKGALDSLLACCDQVEVGGTVLSLDRQQRASTLAAGERAAAGGLRVLGVAMRIWPDPNPAGQGEDLESGLTFLGLVAMIDPARPEVRGAVAACRAAGIRPVMITGDHPLTAMTIAVDLGLAAPGELAVTGREVATLDDAELAVTAGVTSVYARVSPEEKLRIVRALQRDGQVVAMTGDGVNDAPALTQAEIGVAMGITGTDVTKDAADLVLRDDNFATIVNAVREGRVVFDNIQKFIRNILSGNVAEVAVMVLAPLTGMPIPLLPLQVLWLNLVTDGLPAMAFAVEPPERGVMQRPPTPAEESLLGADHGRAILTRGAVLTVLTLLPALVLWRAGDQAWQSVLFTSIALAELAGGLAMRSERLSLRRLGMFSNPALIGAIAIAVLLQVVLLVVPFTRDTFSLQPLTAAHWLLVGAIALGYLGVLELEKALRLRRAAARDR